MAAIKVIKSDGQEAKFDATKVRESMIRSGVRPKVADGILKKVEGRLRPKITTKEIYDFVRRELRRQTPAAAARYNLRDALVRLGPAGFNFEKYVASVLNAYGYKAETPEGYQGACIFHEVDVTAEKEGRVAFIEAKFRHSFNAAITIKDTLATWSRFLDLVDGSRIGQCPHFDEAWIVTNARFTDQSLEYGHCKNMMLIGWNHPKERSFAKMVDLDALYPITVLEKLNEKELDVFAKNDIMLCRDVSELSVTQLRARTGLGKERLGTLKKTCKAIVEGQEGPKP